MAVVAGEEEEWRQWQRATMGVVVLDDIDNDDCDGAINGNYEDDNCDGAMDDFDDNNDDNDVDGDGAIDDNDDDNDSDDNVVAKWACASTTVMTLAAHPLSWQGAG
jgi:hypothetical protein